MNCPISYAVIQCEGIQYKNLIHSRHQIKGDVPA